MAPDTLLEHDGLKQPISEWALDYGITPWIIIARLERGMDVSLAITKPMFANPGQKLPGPGDRVYRQMGRGRPSQVFTYMGLSKTVSQWSDFTGISTGVIHTRLRDGWSIDRALSEPMTRGRRSNAASATLGVPSDLKQSQGTGAGSTVQESPNIDFFEKAN